MTHFLRVAERDGGCPLTKPRAGMKARVEMCGKERTLVLRSDEDDPFIILRCDVQLVRLPDSVKVIEPNTGKVIKASKQFWVTLETFDPYHAVVDMEAP